MSRVFDKSAFCISKIKAAADQRLCFSYIDSKIPLLPKKRSFMPLAILCGCIARFVSDLVRNLEDRISRDAAHIILWRTDHYAGNIALIIVYTLKAL